LLRSIQRLLKSHPEPPNTWSGPGTPLFAAVRASRTDVTRLLLRARANANERDDKGVAALHLAVFEGGLEMVQMLLMARAEIDACDRHGQTPLFFAPSRDICRLLLDRRADAGLLNRKGQSALHLAGRAGLYDVLACLTSRASRQLADLRDEHGATAKDYIQQICTPLAETAKASKAPRVVGQPSATRRCNTGKSAPTTPTTPTAQAKEIREHDTMEAAQGQPAQDSVPAAGLLRRGVQKAASRARAGIALQGMDRSASTKHLGQGSPRRQARAPLSPTLAAPGKSPACLDGVPHGVGPVDEQVAALRLDGSESCRCLDGDCRPGSGENLAAEHSRCSENAEHFNMSNGSEERGTPNPESPLPIEAVYSGLDGEGAAGPERQLLNNAVGNTALEAAAAVATAAVAAAAVLDGAALPSEPVTVASSDHSDRTNTSLPSKDTPNNRAMAPRPTVTFDDMLDEVY